MSYSDYLKTKEWRLRADECKRRAGYRCQVCNSPDRLQAHHRTYVRIYKESPGDLTCLCDRCHSLVSAVMPQRPYQWLRLLGWQIDDSIGGNEK